MMRDLCSKSFVNTPEIGNGGKMERSGFSVFCYWQQRAIVGSGGTLCRDSDGVHVGRKTNGLIFTFQFTSDNHWGVSVSSLWVPCSCVPGTENTMSYFLSLITTTTGTLSNNKNYNQTCFFRLIFLYSLLYTVLYSFFCFLVLASSCFLLIHCFFSFLFFALMFLFLAWVSRSLVLESFCFLLTFTRFLFFSFSLCQCSCFLFLGARLLMSLYNFFCFFLLTLPSLCSFWR